MVRLITETERNRQALIAIIDDLRQRVERGELRALIVGFATTDGATLTSSSGGASFAEQIGLIELAKHDLIAKSEDRVP